MYSPAEDHTIESYLEHQVDKLGSYDAGWSAVEAKFDVLRPVIGDTATSGAGLEKPTETDWDAIADQEDAIDYAAPERLAKRLIDARAHTDNNFLSGVMTDEQKLTQQKINTRRPSMSWEIPKGA